MKRTDITHSVMDKVVQFEEQRAKRWIRAFIVSITVLIIIAVAFFYRTYRLVSERHTLDVLEIFYQDREIISEFWQDTLLVAVEELPHKTIITAGLALAILGVVWFITRRRRQIVSRRLTELAKRKKNSNNI